MYSTSANLKIIGRSIAIDLSDANIDNCRVADPHTILFFRKTPEWTEEELETLQKIRLDLLKNNKVAFSLNEW